MRIADPTHLPSTRCGTYADGFRFSVRVFRLVALVAAALLLPAQAIPLDTIAPRGDASADAFVPPVGDLMLVPNNYNCTSEKVKESETGQEGLREAIREAINILETCPACKQFFRRKDPQGRDPVEYIKELDQKKRILLTAGIPEDFDRVGKIFAPKGYQKFNDKQLGVRVTPRLSERRKPCIYLNASSFAGSDKVPIPPPYDGLPRPRARGILLLHEFGHVVAAIARDGDDKSGWKSSENTRCIREMCEPCAAKVTECEPRPKPDWLIKQLNEKLNRR